MDWDEGEVWIVSHDLRCTITMHDMIHDDVDHPVSGSVDTGSPLSIQSDMGIPHVYMSLPFYAEAAFFGIHTDGNSPSPLAGYPCSTQFASSPGSAGPPPNPTPSKPTAVAIPFFLFARHLTPLAVILRSPCPHLILMSSLFCSTLCHDTIFAGLG